MILHPAITNTRVINRFKTLKEDFIRIHGEGTHTYDNVVYSATRDKATFYCNACQKPFTMKVNCYLNGQGCPPCGRAETVRKRTKPRARLLEQLYEVHGDRYDYVLVNYINDHTDIDIICKRHGIFTASPNNHLLKASNCPRCWEIERQCNSTNRPTCLYYVKISNKTAEPIYKIGITTRQLPERFTNENFKEDFEILFQSEYQDRREMVTLEQDILAAFKSKLLNPSTPILIPKNGGDNELFTEDVLNMETLPNNCSVDVIQEALTKLKETT